MRKKKIEGAEKPDCRVFVYGICYRKGADGRRPVMAAVFHDQLWRANIYYNKRVEMENARKNAWRSIRSLFFPKLAAAEAAAEASDLAVEDCRNRIKKDKAAARTRKVNPVLKAELKVLTKARSTAKKTLSERRKEYKALLEPANKEYERRYSVLVPEDKSSDVYLARRARKSVLESMVSEKEWPEFWKQSKKLDFDANEAKNLVRSQSGLTKGTYDLVDKAFEQASKASKGAIRFHRYSGGRVGLAVSASSEEIMSGSGSSFRIDPLPPGTWDTQRGRRNAITNVRLRLGRGVEEIVFPIVMHRPLPEGAKIKAVWLKEETYGVRKRHELQITVEGGSRPPRAAPPPKSVVALNLSWKMVEGGLRAGFWVGSDGREGEVLIKRLEPGRGYTEGNRSEYLYDSLSYPSVLSTYIKKNFNFAMGVLLETMQSLKLPSWTKGDKDLLKTVSQWKSPMRLCGYSRFLCEQVLTKERMSTLWSLWRAERLSASPKLDLMPVGPGALREITAWAEGHGVTGRLEVFSLFLEIWRRKHVHLYDWKNQTMDRAMRARREMYRILAKSLSETYETLLVEDFDLRDVVEDSPPEEESEKIDGVGLNRTIAATSTLRSSFIMAFGGRHRKYPAHGNTIFHAGCGGVMIGDVDNVLMTCSKCGRTDDRDRNNCLNQLDIASGSSAKPSSSSSRKEALATAVR